MWNLFVVKYKLLVVNNPSRWWTIGRPSVVRWLSCCWIVHKWWESGVMCSQWRTTYWPMAPDLGFFWELRDSVIQLCRSKCSACDQEIWINNCITEIKIVSPTHGKREGSDLASYEPDEMKHYVNEEVAQLIILREGVHRLWRQNRSIIAKSRHSLKWVKSGHNYSAVAKCL